MILIFVLPSQSDMFLFITHDWFFSVSIFHFSSLTPSRSPINKPCRNQAPSYTFYASGCSNLPTAHFSLLLSLYCSIHLHVILPSPLCALFLNVIVTPPHKGQTDDLQISAAKMNYLPYPFSSCPALWKLLHIQCLRFVCLLLCYGGKSLR